MTKLNRNPGIGWYFFVLHRKHISGWIYVCSCIHVYKYINVFWIYRVWGQSPICDGPFNLRGCASFVSVLRQLRPAEISVLEGRWCVRKRVASNTVSLRALWVYDLIPLTAWSKIACICWLWRPFLSATTRDICLGQWYRGVVSFKALKNYIE